MFFCVFVIYWWACSVFSVTVMLVRDTLTASSLLIFNSRIVVRHFSVHRTLQAASDSQRLQISLVWLAVNLKDFACHSFTIRNSKVGCLAVCENCSFCWFCSIVFVICFVSPIFSSDCLLSLCQWWNRTLFSVINIRDINTSCCNIGLRVRDDD